MSAVGIPVEPDAVVFVGPADASAPDNYVADGRFVYEWPAEWVAVGHTSAFEVDDEGVLRIDLTSFDDALRLPHTSPLFAPMISVGCESQDRKVRMMAYGVRRLPHRVAPLRRALDPVRPFWFQLDRDRERPWETWLAAPPPWPAVSLERKGRPRFPVDAGPKGADTGEPGR